MSATPLYACVSKTMKQEILNAKTNKIRAAFLTKSLWPKKYEIKIAFMKNPYKNDSNTIVDPFYNLNKAKFVEDIVKRKLQPYIDITFKWDVPLIDSDVRIGFTPQLGAWSTVGTDARYVKKDKPTMNLGWIDDESNYDAPEYKNTGIVVLHEFGHMLGMIHEHSREDTVIEWDKEAVYKSLGKSPNNWSKNDIDEQIFQAVKKETFNGSDYDKKSMMHYFFPNEFFKNKPDLPKVVDLSEKDKEWLVKIYGQEKLLQEVLKNSGGVDSGKNYTVTIVAIVLILAIIVSSYVFFPKIKNFLRKKFK